ncbi:penicillin-binding protein activator [Sphingomicrobium sp. B8]|uniref:Penicillin-binding protein activator n=2 Tax=Sphingomicrobium clamense TaxID=2851013 RepID=A0ABS6V5C3_9SPHN|nr:penicillin-binding protein activator [Sphingomicrobium sp. B8]
MKGALAAAVLALGACTTSPAPRGPAPSEPATAPTPAPTPVAERNGVAVLVPLTGDNQAVGNSIANAAKMALLDSEVDTLRLTIYDTAGGAEAAARQALAEGNKLILGPLLSENVRAVGPIAAAADVPVIAFSNDEGVADDNVYIMGFTPTQSIARSVAFAADNGVSTFAGLIPNSLYGQRAINSLIVSVEDHDGRLAALETYERSRSALEAAIGKINARDGIDAVVIGDGGQIAKLVAPRLTHGGWKIGNELWAAERDLGQTAALRGAIYSAVPDGRFQTMSNRYRSRYGNAPYRLSSLGYDAVLLAARLSRDWESGGDFPTRLLRADDGFGGVDGIFRFEDNVAIRALEVRRVTPGGTEILDPAARAF